MSAKSWRGELNSLFGVNETVFKWQQVLISVCFSVALHVIGHTKGGKVLKWFILVSFVTSQKPRFITEVRRLIYIHCISLTQALTHSPRSLSLFIFSVFSFAPNSLIFLCSFMTWSVVPSLYLSYYILISLQARSSKDQKWRVKEAKEEPTHLIFSVLSSSAPLYQDWSVPNTSVHLFQFYLLCLLPVTLFLSSTFFFIHLYSWGQACESLKTYLSIWTYIDKSALSTCLQDKRNE